MTIDRAIEDIEYISNWNALPTIGYRKGEDVIISEKSLKLAIDTMRKYQKIEEIYETWLADGRIDTHKAISMISEIINEEVEDGGISG